METYFKMEGGNGNGNMVKNGSSNLHFKIRCNLCTKKEHARGRWEGVLKTSFNVCSLN